MQRTAESVMAGLLVLQCVGLIAGCHKTPMPPSEMTGEVLKNATYRLADFPDLAAVKLNDGRYVKKIPGTAMEESVRLESDLKAFADLNGDGTKDAAAILVISGGGSGAFYRLVVLINQNGSPQHVATAALGDRVRIRDISINSGLISIDMLAHGPEDALCCPTMPVIRRYRLNGTRLIEIVDNR